MKSYIGIIYADDGQLYRTDKGYKTRLEALHYLKRMRLTGEAATFLLYDGYCYDFVMMRLEVIRWLHSCDIDLDSSIIIAEATVNNVKAMLVV